MDINQILSDLAILAGMLLVAVLAIGPLWLSHESREARTQLPPARAGSRVSHGPRALRP